MPKLEGLDIEWIEFTTFKRQIHFNLTSGIDEISSENFRFQFKNSNSDPDPKKIS